MAKTLEVCVHAALRDGRHGGVQQIVLGLAQGLAELDGPEAYHFLAYRDSCEWLKPFLRGPCRLLEGPPAPAEAPDGGLRRRLKGLTPFKQWREWRSRRVPGSGGWAERAGAQAVHFPFQEGYLTSLPTLYQPHDLQHLSYPENFSAPERHRREAVYRRLSEQASAVVLMSRWGKRDMMSRWGYPSEKIAVVPGGAVTLGYPEPSPAELEEARRRQGLPERFLYYPAQTFPHKNHARLFEALALLKSRGLAVGLVCSGAKDSTAAALERQVRSLGLGGQVVFTGFLQPADVACLYRLCLGMVFPSLFEGWGLPLTEAMAQGVPIAASNAACIPEQVQDAALLFDAKDPAAIAGALERLWSDEGLRSELAAKGHSRAATLTWASAARTFRALYRRAAGQALGEEDRALLEECYRL